MATPSSCSPAHPRDRRWGSLCRRVRGSCWIGLADHTHTLVESYDGGWAWSVPVSRDRRYVTVMVDPAITDVRPADGAMGLTGVYAEELAKAARLDTLARSGARPPRLTAPP